MSTSATLSEQIRSVPALATTPDAGIVGRVGATPLVRLTRSAEGLVSVKREGQGAFGGFLDRVALAQLRDVLRGERVWLEGLDSFAVASAAICAARGARLDVVTGEGDPLRLRELINRYGARVHAPESGSARLALRNELEQVAARRLDRANPDANASAWKSLVGEVRRDATSLPQVWVCAPVGGTAEIAADALREVLGRDAEVVTVEHDSEGPSERFRRSACRRTQVAHREGILLSPLGAELVDVAIDIALTRHVEVCAVLPEEGHRYLGWW